MPQAAPNPTSLPRGSFRWAIAWFATAALILELLRRTGAPAWLLYTGWTILGIWFVLWLLCLPVLYFYLKRNPVNRLASLVQARKFEQAIALGESLPPQSRTSHVEFNLAIAYRLAGRVEDARILFDRLRAQPNLPSGMLQAIQRQLAHLPSSGQAMPE